MLLERPGIVALVAACSCGLIHGHAGKAQEVTVGRIAAVWAEREARVKSCRVVWTETTTYPKGTSFIDPRAEPKHLPPTDLTLKAKCKIVILGQKSRYERDGQMWSTESRKVGPEVGVSTFDGSRSARTTLQSVLIANPQVILKTASESPQSRTSELFPIWLTARASIVSKEMPIEQFAQTGRKEKINNRVCHEFSRKVSARVREQVFLDPDRDYLVTRYINYTNDKLWMKLEITYQPEPTLGWVPATWDVVVGNPMGGIGVNKRCVVTEFATNIDVPESDFEPVFPIGARVIDLTTGKEMHSGILPTGERGKEIEYVPGKGSPSYETLMAQPPQRELWARAWPWALAGGGLLVVGVAIWWMWRKSGLRTTQT